MSAVASLRQHGECARLRVAAAFRSIATADDHRARRFAYVVAVVALVVRVVGYVRLQNDLAGHCSDYLVMGVPYSDAQGWDALGESVMRGHGLAGGWSARRPFFALAIGALYGFTGPEPQAVVCVQIVLCALTAALICRIGQRVFAPVVGLIGGLAFACDATSIQYTYTTSTETLGTFLFVLSLRQLLVALEQGSRGASWWAGVTFALSNLTRTLTLLAAPLFAAALLRMGRVANPTWRARSVLLFVFALGMALPMGAWIVRQKVVHDLTTISDNTASALYAAASPRHRTWNAEVDRDAAAAGVPDAIKPRYEWFLQRFREQLAADPGFYVRNAAGAAWGAMTHLARPSHTVRLLLVLLLLGLWSCALPRARGLSGSIVSVSFVGALLAWPAIVAPAFAVVGFVAVVTSTRNRLPLLLVAAFVAVIAALGLFGIGHEPRLLLTIAWVVPLATAHGTVQAHARLLRVEVLGAPVAVAPTPGWQRWLVGAAFAVFAVGLSLATYRNFVAPLPPDPALPRLTIAMANEALEHLARTLPAAAAATELQPASSPAAEHGRLVVAIGRLDRHRFRVPARLEQPHNSRMFEPRSYEREYADVSYGDSELLAGPAGAVFAAPMPLRADRDLLLIGRCNVDRTFVYHEAQLEVLAWAALRADGSIDFERWHVTDEPAHRQVVEALRR